MTQLKREGQENLIKFLYTGVLASINQRYVSRGFALSYKYRQCKENIGWEAKKAMKGKSIMTGAVNVVLIFNFKRNTDIDNCVKVLLDGMQGIVFLSDKQIVTMMLIKKHKDKNLPLGVHVSVEEIKGETNDS